MNHVALDRAGADDGDLDHQVIEGARLHAGQEVHLRAGFDLKHANAVCFAEHVIDLGVFGGERGERVGLVMVQFEQIKAFADAGEHAECQHIDLQDAQRVDIVFIPTDDGAVLHRGVFDGHKFVQPPFGDDEAADMLRQVAGEADDLENQLHRQAQAVVVWIETNLAHAMFFEAVGGEKAPKLGGQRADSVLAEAHGSTHLSDCAFAAIVDDGGA